MDEKSEPDNTIDLIHHHQSEFCRTRPAYRQGRRLTAVKAYTVNNESTHLLIFGVPKINLRQELKSVLQKYGKIVYVLVSPNYPSEEFTECFHANFENILSARKAKKFVDMKNFYGSVLHVCYAPELETCQETRQKLNQRKIYIKKTLMRLKKEKAIHESNSIQNAKIIDYQQRLSTDLFLNKNATMHQIICPIIPQPEDHIVSYSQNLYTSTINNIPNDCLNTNTRNDVSKDSSQACLSNTTKSKRPLDTQEYVFKTKRRKKSSSKIKEAIKSATIKLNTLQNPTENPNSEPKIPVLNSDNLPIKPIPKKSTNKIIMKINTKLI